MLLDELEKSGSALAVVSCGDGHMKSAADIPSWMKDTGSIQKLYVRGGSIKSRNLGSSFYINGKNYLEDLSDAFTFTKI